MAEAKAKSCDARPMFDSHTTERQRATDLLVCGQLRGALDEDLDVLLQAHERINKTENDFRNVACSTGKTERAAAGARGGQSTLLLKGVWPTLCYPRSKSHSAWRVMVAMV